MLGDESRFFSDLCRIIHLGPGIKHLNNWGNTEMSWQR
jgi:hypothetical protein